MSGLGVHPVSTNEKSDIKKEGGPATKEHVPPSLKSPDLSVVKNEFTPRDEDITDNEGKKIYSFTTIKDEPIELKTEEIDIGLEDVALTSEVPVHCANKNGMGENEAAIKEEDTKEDNSLCLPLECIIGTAAITNKEKDIQLERDEVLAMASNPATLCGPQNLSPITITLKGTSENHGNEFNSSDRTSSPRSEPAIITGIQTGPLVVLKMIFENNAKADAPLKRQHFRENTPIILKRRPLFKSNLVFPRDKQLTSSNSYSPKLSVQRFAILQTSNRSKQLAEKPIMSLNSGATSTNRRKQNFKQHLLAYMPSISRNHSYEPSKSSSECHPNLVNSGKSSIFSAGNSRRITTGIQHPVVLKIPCDKFRGDGSLKLTEDCTFSKLGMNRFQFNPKLNVSKKSTESVTCLRTQSKKMPPAKPANKIQKLRKAAFSVPPVSKEPSLCGNRSSNSDALSKTKVEVQSLLAFLSNEESFSSGQNSDAFKRKQDLKQCSVADEQLTSFSNRSYELHKLSGSEQPTEILNSGTPCPDPERPSSPKHPLSKMKDGPHSEPLWQVASHNNLSSEFLKLHDSKSRPITCVNKQSSSSQPRVVTDLVKDVAGLHSVEPLPKKSFTRVQCPDGSETKNSGINLPKKPITNLNSNAECKTIMESLPAFLSDKKSFSSGKYSTAFETLQNLKRRSTNEKLFECPECSVIFETRAQVERHLVVHLNEQLSQFSCEHCAATFRFKSALKRHSATHSDMRPFSCEHCAAAFKRKSCLKVHLVTHSDETPFSCEHCAAAFKMKSDLEKHSVTHSDKRPFSCKHCTAVFKTKRALKLHSVTHSDTKPFCCEHCPARFKRKSSLKLHLAGHSDKTPFLCNHCDAAFKRKTNLNQHLVTHLDMRPFSCEHCAAEFKTKQALRQHSRTHSDKRPFSCEDCTAKFKTKQVLKLHLDKMHSGNRLFSCKSCAAVFQTWKDLKNHAITHTDEKPFLCTQCSATFRTKQRLKNHLNVHSNEKPFLCEQCAALFKTAQHLRNHSLVHSDRKPFSCAHCGLAFKSKTEIKIHLRVHSKERPFSCLKCDASFKSRSLLTSHFLKHSDERPFSCPRCSATFKRKVEVKKHLTRCSNTQRQFSCSVCSVTFKTKADLKRHSPVHSVETSSSCAFCSASFKSKLQLEEHLLSVHWKEEGSLFECKHCPATFKTKDRIRQHLKSHSTKRPYTCEQCSARFKDKQGLKVHIIHHLNERPHACPHPGCNVKFNLIAKLNRHLVLHSEERRYSCAHCSASFKAKVNLKVHMVVHSKRKPFLCSFCAARFKSKLGWKYHVQHAHLKGSKH